MTSEPDEPGWWAVGGYLFAVVILGLLAAAPFAPLPGFPLCWAVGVVAVIFPFVQARLPGPVRRFSARLRHFVGEPTAPAPRAAEVLMTRRERRTWVAFGAALLVGNLVYGLATHLMHWLPAALVGAAGYAVVTVIIQTYPRWMRRRRRARIRA
jgi:hypothetical protein